MLKNQKTVFQCSFLNECSKSMIKTIFKDLLREEKRRCSKMRMESDEGCVGSSIQRWLQASSLLRNKGRSGWRPWCRGSTALLVLCPVSNLMLDTGCFTPIFTLTIYLHFKHLTLVWLWLMGTKRHQLLLQSVTLVFISLKKYPKA